MKKTLVFGWFALLVVGIVFSTSFVSAYRGDYDTQGPNYDEDRHELIESAFAALDYYAWYELMTENGRYPRVVDVVTEDNFEKFVQAHEAGINGDFETASALKTELGLNNGIGSRDSFGYGRGRGLGQRMQHNSFVDVDNDGVCDNLGTGLGRGRR